MNRTDLVITLFGSVIFLTLLVMYINSWIDPTSVVLKHPQLSRLLGVSMGLTLLWIYSRWENRG